MLDGLYLLSFATWSAALFNFHRLRRLEAVDTPDDDPTVAYEVARLRVAMP